MGQFPSNQQIPHQTYPVTGPTGQGQGHSPLPSHPQAHMHPSGAAGHMQGPGGPGQQQFQRLKVEDALSYLDQVKMQFGNQPQVYNDFLDIMKEFKSQSIDTPGVISRVSNLFKGHPELIVGFNTFLPPGYKIEVHPNDANSISYTTPHQNALQKTALSGQSVHTINLTGNHSGHSVSHNISSFGHHGPSPSPQQQQQQTSSQQPPTSQHLAQSQHQQQLATLSQHAAQQPKHQINNLSQPPAHSQSHQGQQHQRQLHSPPSNQTQPQQPVEFNHAISYVNKIKTRFQGQPDTYKAFLEILHTYQKEQKNIKDGTQFSEQEMYVREAKLANDVYKQVAKLFKNQEDLLQEFSQFLPDANGAPISGLSALSKRAHNQMSNASGSYGGPPNKKQALSSTSVKRNLGQMRRSSTSSQSKVKSRSNGMKDNLPDPSSFGSVAEFAFFDKVRKALRSQKVYEDFLRCLKLFNQEVISRADLVQLVSAFLGGNFPDLFTWFKEFLGYKDSSPMDTPSFKERTSGELAHLEIDYASCKRCGTSYRALPKTYTQPKCTGRTALCREVLNDTWVSFPSWSEDTTFLGTKKTQYEEYIFRCEDERFELDGIIEVNLSTIRVLEAVQKKLGHMTSEEQQKFRLDGCLGGTSEVIHKKAIYRIYGDKASDIIDGLKKTPAVAVPLVLKRLKAKEEEWRAAQRLYNKIWREQNEKYYLKSLDYQGATFKQNDLKGMRSKSLLTEIENIYDEKQEQAAEGNADPTGPHMVFTYKDKSILDDAAGLIVHHMKRQTGIHKEDKSKIKSLLYTFVPDLFLRQGELSDDEDSVKDSNGCGRSDASNGLPEAESDDAYNLMFVNNNWYIFLRLHQMVCERLLKMFQRSVEIAEGEASDKKQRKESTAVALRLKAPTDVDVEEYYPVFLDMVRNLLDGNMESSSFEDTCREMFGVHAYIVFTIDKLVTNIVRQLQTIVVDDTCVQVMDLYQQEQSREGAGGNSATQGLRKEEEISYQKKAEALLNDENCYKFIVHKDKTIITISIELIVTEDVHYDDMMAFEKWTDYVDKFVSNQEIPKVVKERLKVKPVFLPRTSRHIRSKKAPEGEKSAVDGEELGNSPSNIEGEETSADIVNEDTMECKISSNTYKLKFVRGGRSYFYRRRSLPKARKVYPTITRKLSENFQRWLEAWVMENVSRDQKSTCDQWLAGKVDGLRPCNTIKQTVRNNFKSYTKYNVEWPTPAVPLSDSSTQS